MPNLKPLVSITSLLALMFTTLVSAQDPVEVSPDVYKVLLENEHVRVMEMSLPAGKSDMMHSHPLMFTYYLSGSDVRLTAPDGSSRTATLQDGGHYWQQPTTHTVENIGKSDLRVLAVEILNGIDGDIALQHPPEVAAPGTNNLLIDNEYIRVVETITPPGGGGTLHDHMNMAVYTVSDVKLNIVNVDGNPREVELTAGSALWMAPATHKVFNIGTKPSHLLHIEVK